MSFFKLKRCRSNESQNANLDLSHYKRQKLIEDLGKLSLDDHPLTYDGYNDPSTSGTKELTNLTVLPNAVKFKPWKSLKRQIRHNKDDNDDDNDVDNSSSILFTKFIEMAKMESMQLVKWYDQEKLIYWVWWNWNNKLLDSCNSIDYDVDTDVDMDQDITDMDFDMDENI
ncbi:hypothetical protein NCAS_0C02120 [Naumovozyma castellii]|uniref:Uncharacterized protein n=1 Tax=Naumovozyma castellii TaxID=27288 RepID=G0VCJ2_NAUCA|nr:hypothetical protein NCAS_0C02120 [Naumovozyma castellii CBS 4309]CCC69202.1 hypothetical protein NCAS_0C02120 [Naumovozyma castellii CBS 4309]